jgi:hypothetical protein
VPSRPPGWGPGLALRPHPGWPQVRQDRLVLLRGGDEHGPRAIHGGPRMGGACVGMGVWVLSLLGPGGGYRWGWTVGVVVGVGSVPLGA